MSRLMTILIPLLPLLLIAVPVDAADDPLSFLQAFVDARNSGDIAAAAPLMADDTVFVGGPGCTAANPCVGAEAHLAELQGFSALHAHVTLVSPRTSGSTVHARTESQNDLTRAAGVDRTVADLTAEVHDGKITTWRSIQDPNDPQNQAVQAYLLRS